MFRKAKAPASTPVANTLPPVSPATPEHVIGVGMIAYGTLSFTGRLVIEGTVNGPITGEAGSEILIARGGMVEGQVDGSVVRVLGTIEGNVRAQNVYIEDGGVVEGNIEAGTLRTADGARVFGSVCTQATDRRNSDEALPMPQTMAPAEAG